MPDFVVPPARAIDVLLLDILRRVDSVARAQKIGYFLGGARVVLFLTAFYRGFSLG